MSKSSIFRATLGRFLRDEQGTTSIEYAIIASGISVAIIGVVAILGGTVTGFYTNIATALK